TGKVIVQFSVLPGVAVSEIETCSVNETLLPLGTVLVTGSNDTDNPASHDAAGATVAGRFERPARIAGATSAAVAGVFSTPPVALTMACACPVALRIPT